MKITPHGFAVLEGDTHISIWAEESGRLDHDQNTLPFVLPYIRPGDVVVDGGAFIGDHTIAYARAVGEFGEVYAFEPNVDAYNCLQYNMQAFPRVSTIHMGLSDEDGDCDLIRDANAGATIAVPAAGRREFGALLTSLDALKLHRLNFLKLDIEGYEFKALIGAEETIKRCRPICFIELNDSALARNGKTKRDITDLMRSWNYEARLLHPDHTFDMPQTDALFFPREMGKI